MSKTTKPSSIFAEFFKRLCVQASGEREHADFKVSKDGVLKMDSSTLLSSETILGQLEILRRISNIKDKDKDKENDRTVGSL